MIRTFICLGFWMMIGALPTLAMVIQVPADQPTIGDGLIAASHGDTVLVAPGIYVENVDFRGKNVTLASHFLLTEDEAAVRSTIIQGSQPATPDTASTVVFHSGEGAAAQLIGFTVTGGAGTEWVDPGSPDYTWRGGGGIFSFQASPTLRHNLILGNKVENHGDVDGAQGGGMTLFGGQPLVQHNTVLMNEADYGGGVVIDYCGATLLNNLICRNIGGQDYGGGGIWTIGHGSSSIILDNNTIVDNESPTTGGGLFVWSSTLIGRNNIIWGNRQEDGGPIAEAGSADIRLTYTDVEGSYPGRNNIDADPQFADTTHYYLTAGSPCVDAGDTDPACQDPEDPENPGFALWPALGGVRNDMGAYGGPGSAILAPAFSAVREDETLRGRRLVPEGPNPFRSVTHLGFDLPREAPVALQICDAAGRVVRTLIDRPCGAGRHETAWDGRTDAGALAPAGCYFCRLAIGPETDTRRITRLH